MKSVGIIGFGRFGQFASNCLRKQFKVFVTDFQDKKNEANKIGVTYTSLEKCSKKDIIILCVPISEFEKVLRQIVPFLKKGALIMEKLIPKDCECIGTHPLFGPDTAKNGLNGKKIVLCPIKTTCYPQVQKYLKSLGLNVITTSPEEHDKQMAKSLALVHLLGNVILRTGMGKVEMSTPTHEMFIKLVDIVKNESDQHFSDMQKHNKFTRKTRKILINELIRIDGELNATD